MFSYIQKDRIYQGDIFKDIKIPISVEIEDEELSVKSIFFPFVIVMTQDCDLQQDFNTLEQSNTNQRNCLLSILLCPLFYADVLKQGIHFEEIGINSNKLNSGLWSPIKGNKDKRYYHFTEETVDIAPDKSVSVPESVIDFKHYQTIQRDYLYELYGKHYFLSVDTLFREKISDRFTHFLARIGLPEPVKPSKEYADDKKQYCDSF